MIEIREALIQDAKGIVNVNISSWIDTYTNIFPKDFLNMLESKREESIDKCKNNINEYIVALDNNKVIGFARIGFNKKGYSNEYAEIKALYILKQYQKQHIGSKLIDYSFLKLKNKYKYCVISTLQQNSANLFYQKIGGKIIDTSIFRLQDKEYIENVYIFKLKEGK